MTTEDVARICHEANRAYCITIGDDSQPAWEDAPAWQRDSAVSGVRFHLANPLAGPADSHREWMQEKIRDGWTYGAVKDPEKKEHPCMVAYAALPVTQRAKGRLFIKVIDAFRDQVQP